MCSLPVLICAGWRKRPPTLFSSPIARSQAMGTRRTPQRTYTVRLGVLVSLRPRWLAFLSILKEFSYEGWVFPVCAGLRRRHTQPRHDVSAPVDGGMRSDGPAGVVQHR